MEASNMWKELKQKIDEHNDSGHPARVEWSSDGKDGKGKLTNINIERDYVEFFITDDRQEVGSFMLKSLRSVIGISPQEGEDLHIFSHFMGNITILHEGVKK
jgi:hypothetical protein